MLRVAPSQRLPIRPIVALVFAGSALSACATVAGGPTLGLAGDPGKAIQASIIAEMNGGLVGGDVGEGLSGTEKARALEAEYRALEYTPAGQKVAWAGNGGARRGEVVAGQPYRVGAQDCRQYQQTVFTEQGSRTARGAACRNPDGGWTPL